MNKITNEDILRKVKKEYDNHINLYGENRIVGAYALGMPLYGFAEKEEEIKILILYIPTFRELVLTSFLQSPKDSNIFLCDIRRFKEFFFEKDAFLEILFTPYAIENPLFENLFSVLKKNKEELASVYIKKNSIDMQRKIYQDIKEYEKTPNSLLAFSICRKHIMLYLYSQNNSFTQSLIIQQDYYKYYLYQVKNNQCSPNFNQIKEDLKNLPMLITSSEEINQHKERIADVVFRIVNKSFTETKKKMSKEDFINSLTKTEKKAFKFLLTKLSNGEGIVSISQLILETNISRPVFKNLLSKMGEVAEINNLGVKGTYIKIYNHN